MGKSLQKAEENISVGLLQGGLAETSITDVLQFLHLSKKTGELQLLDLPDGDPVRIYFKQGELVNGVSATDEGLKVLLRFPDWSSGEFLFVPNVLSPRTTIDMPLQQVLLEATRLHDERCVEHLTAADEAADPTGRDEMKSLKELLNELIHIEGINTAVLVGRDGFVIEGLVSAGRLDAEAIGAVISTGIGSSEVMGRELQVGDLEQTMVEFKDGIIVVNLVGENAILAVVADLKTPLGNVRYQVKKRLPQIIEALA